MPKTLTDQKSWTMYNAETQKIWDVTHKEFKDLLDTGGIKLKGEFIIAQVDGHKIRIWVDAILKSEYFQ